ncbi:glycosyltransferase family 2 protein [Shewanella algae]|nr:glycosyltransferase family 2 protein [Shewanella algae]
MCAIFLVFFFLPCFIRFDKKRVRFSLRSISVGLLSYARTDLLIETLSNISSDNFNIKVYLLNNNPDVCILNEVRQYVCQGVQLEYYWFHENLGVARGRRKLVELCTERYMILLDDDVYIEDFDKICANVSNEFLDEKVGGIAFHILECGKNSANRYEIPHKNKEFDLDKDQDTYLMIGAGHAIDVELAMRVGNYPDDFGLYGFEEVDLSFRMLNEGFKIRYLHNCVIEHKKSPDGRFSNELVNYLAFVNRTRMAKRYLKFRYFCTCYFVRSIFFLLKTRNFGLFVQASREILRSEHNHKKFGSSFYHYIRKCRGFLWY